MSRLEDRIMDLAARQHGLVTRRQLLDAGLGRDTIKYRIRVGQLRPVHRGVYRIGPVVAPRAPEMAAVLACGPEAVLSHRGAGVLWEILPRGAVRAPVDITVRSRNRRRRAGVRVRRDPHLGADEVIRLQGIPTTTSTRTVFDLATVIGPSDLERVLARADKRGLADLSALSSLAMRYPTRRGSGTVRSLLGSGRPGGLTRSEAEERLLELMRRAELPRPEVNVSLKGYEVDFLWRAERLVVEVDGFAFHSSRSSFEDDRQRDAVLAATAYQVVRVTWRQIVRRPEATVARLAQALAVARSRG